MVKVNSTGGGCFGDWMCFCDTCKAAACPIYDHTTLAYLCKNCDEQVHAPNSIDLSTEHGWIYPESEHVPAAFTCSANALAHQYIQVPIPPFTGLAYATSSTYLDELPGPILEPENKIMTFPTKEIDEDETDCWLLFDPDNNDNQTNSWFPDDEDLDNSFRIKEQNNQQEIYSSHQSDSGSDGIVPVQSFEVKQEVRHQQQQ